MKKNIITVAAIGASLLFLAGCSNEAKITTPLFTHSPAPVNQIDTPMSGQIDISDDAVTAREATKSGKTGKGTQAPMQNSY